MKSIERNNEKSIERNKRKPIVAKLCFAFPRECKILNPFTLRVSRDRVPERALWLGAESALVEVETLANVPKSRFFPIVQQAAPTFVWAFKHVCQVYQVGWYGLWGRA